MRRSAYFDSLLLVLLASALIWPLFGLEYLNVWSSIESTFIADARMLRDRLPHPGWQPLWYCGTRFDYIYPPALRYGTALISKFGGVSTARSYHFYTALLYVLGIVSVYWLVRAWSRSRIGALLATAGVALFSPVFLLLSDLRIDSGYWVPQRLHALMSYGEGPHISALSVLPAALAASFLALRKWGPIALAGAGLLCAFTVANNFYGATALAIFFPILTWSVWVTHREYWIWLRAAGVIALSYALSAVWLTPDYVRITIINLGWVSSPGNTQSRIELLVAIAVFCAITWWWSGRRPERSWFIFVAGVGFFLSLYVLGFRHGFRVAGEAIRLAPELDLALILVSVEIIRACWKRPILRVFAILIPMVAAYPIKEYLRHVYSPFPKSSLENQYEYLISKWAHQHLPGERIMATGTVRYWFDAWFDNQQLDGGSMQGMLNQFLPVPEWQIVAGEKGELAVLWFQATGTDAVIVPDRTSPEPYHDFGKVEKKFAGAAPVLYDDQHGTVVYRIPRVHPGIGRTVDAAKLTGIGKIVGGDDDINLKRYLAEVENPNQSPTPVQWISFEEMAVQAQVSKGQSVLLQETYDPAWHAYEDGKSLTIRPEPVMGFMLVELPEGNHRITLQFETPLENRVGQVISVLALAIVAALVIFGLRTKQPKAAV